MLVSLAVNEKHVRAEVEPRRFLVDFLRDDLGLTGTKVGCDTSQCGSCTVMVDGRSAKSCTVLAVQADGARITTIEGVATNGGLTALQEGFHEEHAVQCGFCTPGMVISMMDLLARSPHPTEAEIRAGLEGNLCRCTGYENVVKAVKYAVAKQDSPAKIVADSPAKRFYERQVKYLLAGDADSLVDDNYNDDAMVISHDFVVRGRAALKEHFRNYLHWVQIKEVKSTNKFTEADDCFMFEATVESNHGVVTVYDVFLLRDGKVHRHFTGVK